MACFVKRLGEALGLALGLLIVLALSVTTRSSTRAAAQPVRLQASTVIPPFTITVKLIANGLSSPVAIANAADGSGRLFALEQAGTVRVIKNSSVLSTPYLSLTNQVACCGERGLLGIAFDPAFGTNGTFYLNYTTNATGHFGATVIARYQVSSPSADVANVLTVTRILTIEQPEANHNGGNLLFGPIDHDLYIGMGDGGGGGDKHGLIGNGQDPTQLLGKMLRIDVRGTPTYTIPTSNPFTRTAGYRPEIWALGLRNPWRFSFDRGTGDLYIGDVGQNCWEEVDYQSANSAGGQNYGWRIMEGYQQFDQSNFNNCSTPIITPPTLTLPITTYGHILGNEAVSGGYVYRGHDFPWLSGIYFYADYASGRIWAAAQTSPGVWWSAQKYDAPFSISTFGEDENGELYIANYSGGEIYRITSPPPINFVTSTKQASRSTATSGEVLTYTVVLRNTGLPFSSTVRVTDVVPSGLGYVPGSLTASSGTANAANAPTLRWSGIMSDTSNVTITYRASVVGSANQTVINTALIDPAINSVLTRSVSVLIVAPDLSASFKRASKVAVRPGERVTYTVVLRNQGSPLTYTLRETDIVPIGVGYVLGSFTATRGTPDSAAAPILKWTGVLSSTPLVTLTYVVTVSTTTTQVITNDAIIAPGYTPPFTRSATIVLNGWSIDLPVVLKN